MFHPEKENLMAFPVLLNLPIDIGFAKSTRFSVSDVDPTDHPPIDSSHTPQTEAGLSIAESIILSNCNISSMYNLVLI